jgi:peptidoglycan glycosyltransferase
MNAPLRKVGVVVMVLFGLLFANLNWVQVYKSDEYTSNDVLNHIRVQAQEYERARGNILVSGVAVAKSRETTDTLKYERIYPFDEIYAHIVGYKPVNLGATDVEKMENQFLAGTADTFIDDRIAEMFTGKRSPGGNVLLTVSKQVQETAYNELSRNQTGAKRGAVVALDPSTGALLALASTPSFDPNKLSSHDTDEAAKTFSKLDKDSLKPLLNRAVSETFPPGSTFKVVVATAALQAGVQPGTTIKGGQEYTAPDTTTPIRNAPGVACPSSITLQQALTVSCNTAFARLGVEELGADKLKAAAQAYGFGEAPTFAEDERNDMNVASSDTGTIEAPDGSTDRPALAQSCIGQRDVRMTPLQGALIAASIANGGPQMRPYMIDTLQESDLSPTYHASPSVVRTPINADVAGKLRDMMLSVVENGTGRNAQIPGVQVGGKTGTAQNGDEPDHGWFIGFAIKDGKPIVAVAVMLQNAGFGGSGEATRIAGQVMRAALAARGLK